MTLKGIEVTKAIESAKLALSSGSSISPAFRSLVEVLILIIELLLDRTKLATSRTSHKPPSQDPHRARPKKSSSKKRKSGGQPGHEGSTLEQVEDPDHVEEFLIDRRTLPRGKSYTRQEDEVRQVIEIRISREVTEYRAEVLKDEDGKQYVAEFPKGVTRPAQYGPGLKGQLVYHSTYQLLPYARVQSYFRDQAGIELSQGTIYNSCAEAYELLVPFEELAKEQLQGAAIGHFDETGININGKLHWLHSASNNLWTLSAPHQKRGKEAMDEIGILPKFLGTACHDHWKAYFRYKCIHALCNAHHLRELEWVSEHEKRKWSRTMQKFLLKTNDLTTEAGGSLPMKVQAARRKRYRKILCEADIECPPEEITTSTKKIKRSKEQNLILRLRDFENEVLLFMTDPLVPFTNNQGERDIRMTKVQQKISGCFRSFKGAQIFCRVRSYISTCLKHGIDPTTPLSMLFSGRLTEVLQKFRLTS